MRIFSYEELDELGEGLIRQYLGKEAERTCCVDIEGFVTDFLKLPLLYRSFAEEDSDKIGFIADGVTPLRVYEGGTVVRRVYPRGTIVIERCLRQEHESGRRRFTISHECAHYIMDRAFPSAAFHREFDNERIYSQEDFKNLFSFRETHVKDPEDKNHLLVDAEAADVIRRIFQMAADGAKPWQIAAALNGDGVSSPKNYKVEAGCTRTPWRSIQEENFWTANLVAKFLRDERYIGKTVYGKRSRDIVGSTHTVKISRNDWIVVPDRHEAIVPEALFEKAQTCMREYREREVMTGGGNPLKRKVICGVCGHAMQRDNKKNGSYRCVTKRLNTGFDCSEEKVPEADILEAVIDTIQVYAQYAVSIDRLLQTRQAQRQLDRKQAQRRLQTLQSRKAQLDERLQDLYERLVEGEISRESFAAQKKALTAQAEDVSHTVLELERKISGNDDSGNAVIEQFKSYAGITALTREISIELLQSVTIYPDGRMDIRLNLADEIESLLETLRRESCTA